MAALRVCIVLMIDDTIPISWLCNGVIPRKAGPTLLRACLLRFFRRISPSQPCNLGVDEGLELTNEASLYDGWVRYRRRCHGERRADQIGDLLWGVSPSDSKNTAQISDFSKRQVAGSGRRTHYFGVFPNIDDRLGHWKQREQIS